MKKLNFNNTEELMSIIKNDINKIGCFKFKSFNKIFAIYRLDCFIKVNDIEFKLYNKLFNCNDIEYL